MKVILKQNIAGLGQKGDEKEVKPGYARNFLLPKGLIVLARTSEAKGIIEESARLQENQDAESNKIEQILAKNQNTILKFKLKTKSGKKAFGSVKSEEIIAALQNQLGIKPKSIKPKTALKTIGEHKIQAVFSGGQKLDFSVLISSLSAKNNSKIKPTEVK